MNSCYTCIVQAVLPAAWSWKFGTVTKTLCSLMHVLWGWGRHVETAGPRNQHCGNVCWLPSLHIKEKIFDLISVCTRLLQIAAGYFFTHATFVVGSHLGFWNQGMPQISGDFWSMFCEWFPSCFITSLERLDLCLHHMCLHSLNSCSQVGKDSPNESVYASNGKIEFIPVTLLIVVKNTCCFLVYREQPSEFLGQMWSRFPCN